MTYSDIVVADSALAYWPMGEASGNAIDHSGNGKNLTWQSTHPTQTDILSGVSGGVTLAADNEAKRNVEHPSWCRPTSGSFEAWIKTSTAALMALCSNRLTTEGGGPTVYLTAGQLIQFGVGKDASTFQAMTTGSVGYADGNLHHVVCTWALTGGNTVGRVHFDGVLVQTTTLIAGGSIDSVDEAFEVAGESGIRRLNGQIGHVALYPIQLSPARITDHYNAGLGTITNDEWANATDLVTDSGTTTDDNLTATSEAIEPIPTQGAGDGPWQTKWYKLAPSVDGTLTVDTAGSDFDTVLAAYTGASLAALVEQTSDDDALSPQSQIVFAVTGATTYYFQVGGHGSIDTGNIVLNWSLDTTPPPPPPAGGTQGVVGGLPIA